MSKRGKCNTIRFGYVVGNKAAFLIQNMCPVTEKYIIEYLDKNNDPIQIDVRTASDVISNAREVLAITWRGFKGIVKPDIISIYNSLLNH